VRTFGETRNCGGCRFWSEMMARSVGTGVEAMCLHSAGSKSGRWTTAAMSCEAWKSGHLGAVDTPPDYGEATRAAYAAEETAGVISK
jgi:hypothetical protein